MNRLIYLCLDAAVAAVPLIPIFGVLDRYWIRSPKRSLLMFALALYFCSMYAVAGLPNISYFRFSPNINLKPFAYMFSDFQNSFLNVLLFMPLGFCLPLFFDTFRSLGRTLFLGFFTSLTIELLQLFTLRATDVNDLITNTFGTFVGWITGQLVLKITPRFSCRFPCLHLSLTAGISFLVMFFLHSFLADLLLPLF